MSNNGNHDKHNHKKYRRDSLWGMNAKPSPRMKLFLRLLPFVILLAGYLITAQIKFLENPDEKIVPTVEKMIEAMTEKVMPDSTGIGEEQFVPLIRTNYWLADAYLLLKRLCQDTLAYMKRLFSGVFWQDTYASLSRFIIGVFLAASVGFILGINMGMSVAVRELFLPIVTFMSFIPPLSILPILLIVLGVGEVAKIALIFIGSVFYISRDIYLAVMAIPPELKVKAQTLGASAFGLTYRVIAPQIIPRLIESVQLSLGSAWLFLIAAEYIGSVEGLGYRIFLSMRWQGMNTIIPYVLWITFLAFIVNQILSQILKRKYKWYLDANSGGR